MKKLVIAAIALMFLLNSEVYSVLVLAVGAFWGLSRFLTAIVESGKF